MIEKFCLRPLENGRRGLRCVRTQRDGHLLIDGKQDQNGTKDSGVSDRIAGLKIRIESKVQSQRRPALAQILLEFLVVQDVHGPYSARESGQMFARGAVTHDYITTPWSLPRTSASKMVAPAVSSALIKAVHSATAIASLLDLVALDVEEFVATFPPTWYVASQLEPTVGAPQSHFGAPQSHFNHKPFHYNVEPKTTQ